MLVIVFSFFMFFAVFFSSMAFVVKLRPTPVLGAAAPALACFIALETVLFNILSLFSLVNRETVLGSHLFLLVLWGSWLRRNDKYFLFRLVKRLSNVSKLLRSQTSIIVLAPIFILLCYQAFMCPPNTWDSMTYHMGRVAHWIHFQSVEYFPTNINRQNEMGPGAEYLILFLQLLVSGDYLANFVQLFSYVVLASSVFYLLKVCRVSGKLITPIVLVTLTTPMLLFQAVTTQNDLVCSVMVLAIIIASIRLLRGEARNIGLKDYFLLGLCLASGFLVKPTSLIVAFPFVFFGIFLQIFQLTASPQRKKTFIGALILVAVIAVVAGPDLWRKVQYSNPRPEVYPLFSGWNAERLSNPLTITGQHLSWPVVTQKVLRQIGYTRDLGYVANVFHPHQDFIGNPVQLLTMAFVFLLTLLSFPFVFFRMKERIALFCVSISPLISWLLFGLIVRNQPWISRLQLPLFILLPCSSVLLSSLLKNNKKTFYLFRTVFSVVAVFSLMFSFTAVARNKSRSLPLSNFFQGIESREDRYYSSPALKKEHDLIIKMSDRLQCRQVGLLSFGDTCDYPLTWRLMRQGTEVRHINSQYEDKWSCIMYQAEDRPIPLKGERWLQVRKSRIWYRNLEYEFNHDDDVNKRSEERLDLSRVIAQHSVKVSQIDGGISIQVVGEDPYLLLPSFVHTYHQSAVLQLIVTSPLKSAVQLFYLIDNEKRYSQQHSIIRGVQQGRNKLYFFLPVERLKGQIRLDFGLSNEEYILHSAELKPIR
ncbi:MAG: hypothetical protein Q3M24_05110 [Candidatus Electrothrix aestuarii]|uniref:Dolichyl-phosphate-mannose-protein mannosyltransferase n=1 Tax=Candidatus Electrothrix aestuarii TaxID=3062594 RepID=A0AAU8LXX9_9BACT|nr:hypothetical protein [Candidatus Electrothrix aestuarii]